MDVWKDKIEPRLSEIESWASNGVTETGCAANLLIDRKTWAKYRKAKKPLQEALFRGWQKAAVQLRHALMEAAIGGVRVEKREYAIVDKKGNKKMCKEEKTYHIPPNVHACNLLLRNLDRDNWTEVPSVPPSERARDAQDSKAALTDKEMNTIAARFANISADIEREASDIGIDAPATTQD